MRIVLTDLESRHSLFPFTLNKSVADLRLGIYTVREWWTKALGASADFVHTEAYLQSLYPAIPADEYIVIDAAVLPDLSLVNRVKQLQPGVALVDVKGFVAGRVELGDNALDAGPLLDLFPETQEIDLVTRFNNVTDIFGLSRHIIESQFSLAIRSRASQRMGESNRVRHVSNIFVEEGVKMEECVLNADEGPIYIGKNAVLMEGCLIRGPFVMGEGSVLKMGTKIYGGTMMGKYCVGGGEIKNSVLMDYSNKGHDGYLGDSVLGEWCNLGAGTSNSNLKNNASEVMLYNHAQSELLPAGLKCGVIMGDYCKTAINTSINTGTMIGICCNVFFQGLTPKYLPNFTWGEGEKYEFEKAVRDINSWKRFKGKELTPVEIEILKYIFNKTLPV